MEKQKVHYRELGLASTKEMFSKAMAGKYAVPAYNFNNLEQLQAIVTGCTETNSPVIIQVSKGARNYANETMLTRQRPNRTSFATLRNYRRRTSS